MVAYIYQLADDSFEFSRILGCKDCEQRFTPSLHATSWEVAKENGNTVRETILLWLFRFHNLNHPLQSRISVAE